jgi:acid phosphatase family membrane protein YuiD
MIGLLHNPAVIYPIVAWWVAQGIKILIHYWRSHKFEPRLIAAPGGMPSSHSAFVCSIAVAIAMREGMNSSLFALSVGLAGVVMYDAAGVRRAAGRQATVLNQIVEELFQGHPISDRKLQELLGHTPTQVVVGATCGVLCTLVGMMWIWRGV